MVDISALSPNPAVRIYAKLEARGRVVGVLGIEHSAPGQYRERDRRLLLGMADVVALTLDGELVGRSRGAGTSPHYIGLGPSVARVDALVCGVAGGGK